MNRLGILCFATAGAVAVLILEHQAKVRLSERNQVLRQEAEQLTRLEAARRPLSQLQLQSHLSSGLPGEQWRELLRLRGELGVLRQDKMEASRLRVDNARMRSNWVAQLCGGKKLSRAQMEPYLKAKQRSAESLLAASQLTGDLSFLREAQKNFATDPRVAFVACFALRDGATPEEQFARLEAFKQSAPDNALANYLSARAYLKSGQMQEAVGELTAASGKPKFQDYYAELVEVAEEAYQAAGLSPLEAAVVASGQPLPQLGELRGLGQSLGELAQRYRQAGDDASAQAAVQMVVMFGRQLTDPAPHSTVIGELVGLKIEQDILQALDPASPYDTAGRTIRDRLEELARERKARLELVKKAGDPLRELSSPDLAGYYNQLKASGESEALRWLLAQRQR